MLLPAVAPNGNETKQHPHKCVVGTVRSVTVADDAPAFSRTVRWVCEYSRETGYDAAFDNPA